MANMSYQLGISYPPLMVTARVGAWGRTEAGTQQYFLKRFGHRQEVVAVGTQAVQPDNAGVCGLDGLKNQGLGHGCSIYVRALSISARSGGASG